MRFYAVSGLYLGRTDEEENGCSAGCGVVLAK